MRAYSNQATLTETIRELGKRAESVPSRTDAPTSGQRIPLKKRFSRAEVDDIVAAYNHGTTSTELMVTYGLGKSSILKLLHDHGAVVRRQGLTSHQLDRVVEQYAAGASSKRLAADYGVSSATVLSGLHSRGVVIRQRRRLTEHDISRAVDWYRDGKSLSWIGRQFGASHSTISQALQQQNIPLRNRIGRT